MISPLISTEWLADRLEDNILAVVDASWYLPQMERDGHAEYLAEHIPGAVFFGIDEIADTSSGLPHMLPAPEDFAEAAGRLGISEQDTIVVYDGMGLFSAARVWWTFKVMGARKVFVLDGGLPAWKLEGRALESGTPTIEPASFTPAFTSENAFNADGVTNALARKSQVTDVRPTPRFSGEAAEPRAGLRSGHMPGALNVPFSELIENGRLKSPRDLQKVFKTHGFEPDQPFVSSCGSGVTAPLLNLAVATLGIEALNVYDGSWAEWGAREELPVTTGNA